MADDRPRVTRHRKVRRNADADATREPSESPPRPRREGSQRPKGPPARLLDHNELEALATMDPAEFAAALSGSSRRSGGQLQEGEAIQGVVVGGNSHEIYVDIGERAEARLDVDAWAGAAPEPGTAVEAWVDGYRSGAVRLTLTPPRTADPRDRKRAAIEKREVEKLEALKTLQVGQVLTGTVTTLEDFGAFVQIGKASGLVRLPNLSNQRVAHPSDVLTVGDDIKVRVLQIDLERKRLDLGIRQLQEPTPSALGTRGGLGTLGDLFGGLELD